MAHGAWIGPDLRYIRFKFFYELQSLGVGLELDETLAVFGNVGEPDRFFVQFVAAGFNARQIENLVDDVQEMAAARIDIARIVAVGLVADRSENLFFHDFGEAHDGVQGCSQFVAHGGQKA